jgi:hypothetical protein
MVGEIYEDFMVREKEGAVKVNMGTRIGSKENIKRGVVHGGGR